MKVRKLIFVDLRDKKHVDWVNNVLKKKAKIKEIDRYVVNDTGQVIAKLFDIRCLNPFKRKKLIEESNKFLGDTVTEFIKF